jgi:5-methylcytosine-specific restriction endonuclease McrA
MRKAVLTRDGYKCGQCGRGPWLLTVDHVVPVSHGGTGLMSNLRSFCRTCNSSRGNRAERTTTGEYVR